MKALIIREPWIDMILNGSKSWEMRSSNTSVRGRIALIKAGSGLVVGEADLTNSFKPSFASRRENQHLHRIPQEDSKLMDKWSWAWELKNVIKYENPTPYTHPQGAVIWVNLNN